MVDNNQLSDQGVVLEIVVMEPQPTELSWLQQYRLNKKLAIDECGSIAEEIPLNMTQWKDQYILQTASLNTRHILLCLTTLGVAVISFHRQPKTIISIRNTVLTYAGVGVFLTPEIINPFLVFRHNL